MNFPVYLDQTSERNRRSTVLEWIVLDLNGLLKSVVLSEGAVWTLSRPTGIDLKADMPDGKCKGPRATSVYRD